jgi:hypothetical protein
MLWWAPFKVSAMTSRRQISIVLFGLCLASVPANAASDDLALCLDISTRLEAGGDVGDKDLAAAQAACARLAAAKPDHAESVKINAAIATLGDERQHRASLHH